MEMACTNYVLQTASAHFANNMSHLESIPESDDELAHFAPAIFRVKHADLIFLLRKKVQNPLQAHLPWTTWCGLATLRTAKGYTKPLF